MVREFLIGIKAYFDVLSFVREHRIKSFFLLPLILNFLLIVGLIYLIFFSIDNMGFYFSSKMIDWGVQHVADGSWVLKGTIAVISFLLTKMFLLFQFFMLWQFYQLLSLIFLSPLFSYLSERVQESISGNKTDFSIAQFLKDMLRGVQIAIRNIFFQVCWIIVTTFLFGTILPFLSFLLPFSLFMISAFYYGFTMIDYRSEYYHLTPKESRVFVREHKAFALANGIVFQFILMIPIVGTLFAPSFALVAAALGLEQLRDSSTANRLNS